MNIGISISGFIACALAVIYAGTKLSVYGNKIAESTGIGKAWFGLVLMASVTSVPELVNGISAVSIVNAPDLAAGDLFGSCMFNLLILSVLDFFIRKPITSLVRTSHVFAGACGIILVSISGIGIFLADSIPLLGWVSLISPVIVFIYLVFIWLIFRFERRDLLLPEEKKPLDPVDRRELQRNTMIYSFNAVVVVIAALFLPFFSEKIVAYTGAGETFFSTLFVAMTTSAPELVVSIAALRIGSFDLAVGNLFGSNIFNIFILAIDDVFFTSGSLYAGISPVHLLSVLMIIISTGVAAIGMLFRAERKFFVLGGDTLIILFLYLLLMTILFIVPEN